MGMLREAAAAKQGTPPPRREPPPKLWVRSHGDLGSFLNPSGRFLYLRPLSGVKKLSKTLRLRHRAAKPKLNGVHYYEILREASTGSGDTCAPLP